LNLGYSGHQREISSDILSAPYQEVVVPEICVRLDVAINYTFAAIRYPICIVLYR
jgi:hypothetical protein